jgi:rhomboid protease GluP
MAVGLTPKHTHNFLLNDLTPQQFLALATETAKELKWNISYMSEHGLIAYTNNGMFAWKAKVTIKIENGIAQIQSSSTGNELADLGRNKKNAARFIDTLEQLKPGISKEDLDTKYEQLRSQLVPQEEDILILPPPTTSEQFKSFFSLFTPRKNFFITPILIDLNILIFIAMAVSGVNIFLPDNESLLNWGANFRPLTLGGDWWRLITNCFLHIGVFHLLMNMYALLYIGLLLEPLLGRTRFLSAYILTGITASIASLWWHDLTISAGASGAIFGMYGVFLAMLTTDFIEKTTRKALLTSIGIFVGYNLVFGIKAGIDNAAHIGGLLGGLVIGYAFVPGLKRPQENKLKFGAIALLTILFLISSFAVYRKIPNDIGTYDAKMKQFSSNESLALGVYQLPSATPNEQLLQAIKAGSREWNENILLLDSLNDLDLPLELRTRNQLLREYCELRIRSYELMYKTISEHTDVYKQQIEDYNTQVEEKIKEIGGGEQSK